MYIVLVIYMALFFNTIILSTEDQEYIAHVRQNLETFHIQRIALSEQIKKAEAEVRVIQDKLRCLQEQIRKVELPRNVEIASLMLLFQRTPELKSVLSAGEDDLYSSAIRLKNNFLLSDYPNEEKLYNAPLYEKAFLDNKCLWEDKEAVHTWQDLHALLPTVTRVRLKGQKLCRLNINLYLLSGLTELYLQKNCFTIFPEAILRVCTLSVLDISHNKIKKLPASIGLLANLKAFWCSDNKILELPDSFGNMEKLEVFYCNDNYIRKLPETIGNLTELQNLNVKYNCLTTVPKSIANLKKLRWINITNNLLSETPEPLQQLKIRYPKMSIILNNDTKK